MEVKNTTSVVKPSINVQEKLQCHENPCFFYEREMTL